MRLPLILLILAGCGDMGPLKARVSSDLSPECVEHIAGALDYWSENTGTPRIDIRVSDSDKGPSFRELTFIPYTLDNDKWGHTDYEYLIDEGQTTYATIAIRDSKCDVKVVAHELGHAFQLQHTQESGRLMHELYEHVGLKLTSKEITKARKAISNEI